VKAIFAKSRLNRGPQHRDKARMRQFHSNIGTVRLNFNDRYDSVPMKTGGLVVETGQ
jgi:hypothetical protein